MRVRLDFAYDGTDFSGWAAQPGLRTVEGELTAALGRILRADPAPSLTVAGRTDAGVHARGAVAHVDVEEEAWNALPGRSDLAPEAAAVRRLAGVLPSDVVVRRARVVAEDFDARFSALTRQYSYRICDAPELLDPLRRRDTVTVRRPLDVDAMDVAARSLCGLREFAAFCKRREGATTVRTLLEYSWRREGHLVVGTVVADAFCHSMVRALVGAVVPVGEGRRPVEWPAQVQERAERDPGVTVMPAHGLCLEEVTYPSDEDLAARARTARAIRMLPGE
ncbi:tRNA pseudouridine(38-40) synthase TruA [Mobilicoccus pelagius]|uniref:tRNA pseudouridine synthase A n=1 Tax=Mobilicoccus pelagius NBRC 104925 TaxID=1089455 RepID=H5UTY0_9MICO|nr:tRNA pseudouridine(38-40) synthase TruA [Mobilicoccus pelagius]GAB49188.1 tRNA pseudouridine synthase A [Mobilicoccus pelagius NBRC 104925]